MIFGEGYIYPKKPPPRSRPRPTPLDINNPCPKPYCWAHMGREPNTNYHVRLLHYKQQVDKNEDARLEAEREQLRKDTVTIKYDTHAENKRFTGLVKKRWAEKLQKLEEDLEKRREKLQELLANDEREFIWETIDKAQRGGDSKQAEAKAKVEKLKAIKEEERKKVVHEKRMQQYMNRCVDLRTAMTKKYAMEAKNIQLQQMRENEARREAVREEDKLWYDIMQKEIKAKMLREEQEELKKHLVNKECTEVLDIQVKGKELLKQEQERMAEEDRREIEKLMEQVRREEIEALQSKIQKREKLTRELEEQTKMNERFIEQRKKEEKALEDAFTTLVELEIAKEKAKVQDMTTVAKKEDAQYRAYLKKLKEEQRQEEEQLNKMLEENRKVIMQKQKDAQCKMQRAKEELLRITLEGRAEQLEYKKRQAEEQLRFKEAENELIRMACQTNDCLEREQERAKREAAKEYRQDLIKQIEYNQIRRQREREELERQLAAGLEEEEKYRKFVKDIDEGGFKPKVKHPFLGVLERFDCHCAGSK